MLKFEYSFHEFLAGHIELVNHHMGKLPGTAGSSGAEYLMRNKRDQIIWRDLYHLQDHAKSFIDWSTGKNLMKKVQTEE